MHIAVKTTRATEFWEVIEVDAHTRIPPWAAHGLCDRCKHDFDDTDGCVVMISRGRLFYFHEQCFQKALTVEPR